MLLSINTMFIYMLIYVNTVWCAGGLYVQYTFWIWTL